MSDKTSIPQIDFALATVEDYEEVMSISVGIYNGTDQLPFRYHAWLKESQRRMFLARSEGKLVGFVAVLLVDDGTTAVLESLRVASWVRGRGVAGEIERFCLDTLRSDHPKVIRVRQTSAENPPASLLTKYKVMKSKAVISVLLHADQLETAVQLLESRVNKFSSSINLSILQSEEILRFFEESKTRQELLPGGLLVQAWLPLSTCKANLHMLLERKVVWIFTHPGDCSDLASTKATASCGGNHLEGFLSLGTPPYAVSFAEGTHLLEIDLFGNDPACAKVHLLQQLKIGIQALPAGSDVICVLYADETLRTEFNQLFEGLTPFLIVREQMILEMEI